MSNKFVCLGFNDYLDSDVYKLYLQIREYGEIVEVGERLYLNWKAFDEVELWAPSVRDNLGIISNGIYPHFSGAGAIEVNITKIIQTVKKEGLGFVNGWADPYDSNGNKSGSYPFCFCVPNFSLIEDTIKVGEIRTFQITAFSEGVMECFESIDTYKGFVVPTDTDDDDEEYFPSIKSDKEIDTTVVGPVSFFPDDTISDDSSWESIPNNRGFFSGIVLRRRLICNPYTNRNFFYLLVQTIGGNYDVVVSSNSVFSNPIVGGIIRGHFILSGKLIV